MRIFKFLIVVLAGLFISPLSRAEKKLTLEECFRKARQNYPKIQLIELSQKISELTILNDKSTYLPDASINGQATWQNKVVEIDLSPMGIDLGKISKDQYKAYLEFNQSIWDGGLTKNKMLLEEERLKTDLLKLDIEFYQIKGMVVEWYFSILLLDKNIEITRIKQDLLNEQQIQITHLSKAGTMLENNLDQINAELLLIDQGLIGLQSKKQTLIDLLAITMGEDLDTHVVLEVPSLVLLKEPLHIRPEISLFNQQKHQLEISKNLLNASRNPRLFSFGQLGYGRPGLNMLSNEFDTFLLVGVGFKWNIWDKGVSKRKKEILTLQSQSIDVLRGDFERNRLLKMNEYQTEIERLQQYLKTDDALLDVRTRIANRSFSQLQNGVITSADYIVDLNAKTIAQINRESHRLELLKTMVQYNLALGE